MKKRAKIITTIASLCLAVALMAFGVYAAQSATMSISSSVSFVATDVNVQWTLSAVKNATAQDASNVETLTTDNVFHLGEVQHQGAETENATKAIPEVEFDHTHRTITYTFTCENLSNKQYVDIAVDLDAAFADVPNVLTVTYKQGVSGTVTDVANDGVWADATIAPLGTYVYQVVLQLIDITSDINTEAEPQVLTVAFAATKHGAQAQQQNP